MPGSPRSERLFDLLPMAVTLPLVVVIILWNLGQAADLSARWLEREAQEIGREALADFLPDLRGWVNDGGRFVEELATGPLQAAGLRSAVGWRFSTPDPSVRQTFERWAVAGTGTFHILAPNLVFLRWPLRVGPPAGRGGFQGGGPPPWSRGGQRFPQEDSPHDRGPARGPFELALLIEVHGTPPVWPFHAQAGLWGLAWLAGGTAWIWGRGVQRRARALELQGQQEAHLAAIGRMSARLAHEIRNPLGMVRGAAQHLRSPGLPRSDRESLLSLIDQETRRLEHLSQEVLSFCRPPPVTPAPMELVAFLHDFVRQAALDPGQPPVVVEPLPDSCRVQADADALRQVVWNLVRNAREATVAAGVAAAVRLSLAPTPTGVALRIKDRGIGLSPEVQERLFEPFFSGKARGFGLGLAISRRLVESMGGRLTLDPDPEGGCLAEVMLLHDRPTP